MNTMASITPSPADAPEVVQARLDSVCHWFDIKAPAISVGSDGEILLDGPLTKFLHREGINLDWIFCGEVEGLVRKFRDDRKNERKFVKEIRTMSKEEQTALLIVLTSVVDGDVGMSQGMQLWCKAVAQSRELTQMPATPIEN